VSYVKHSCPECGAPLPPPPPTGAVRCRYCALLLAPGPGGWRPVAPPAIDEPLRDPELPRLWLGGVRYAVLGRLARGEGCDAFLARRDTRLTELVVLKVLRAEADTDLFEREHTVLDALERSAVQGTPHYARLLPQRVAIGAARLGLRGDEGERRVAAHRFRSGFVHTFDDVRRAHPGGIAPEATVWLWKRTLDLLGWIHRSGYVHGAVLPAHLLVHARDHGVVLVGFSRAVPPGTPLPAFSDTHESHYPEATWQGGPVSPGTDITMSARAMLLLLGGDVRRAPSAVPAPLATLLESHAANPTLDDAWAVRDAVDTAARASFGAAKFIHFPMPGWG
jgi:hypothetical protein